MKITIRTRKNQSSASLTTCVQPARTIKLDNGLEVTNTSDVCLYVSEDFDEWKNRMEAENSQRIIKKCNMCSEIFEPLFKQQSVCNNCAQNFGCAVCGEKFERGTLHNCIDEKK